MKGALFCIYYIIEYMENQGFQMKKPKKTKKAGCFFQKLAPIILKGAQRKVLDMQEINNEQQGITKDKIVLDKAQKLSKIFLIIGFCFAIICIVVSILATTTNIEALGTVCAIVGVIGGLTSIGLFGYAFVNKSDYCPMCGARIRKTQTFLRRIEGNRYDGTSGYSIPYVNYYHCTSDCALCGWEKEYEKKENAGKLFYSSSDGRLHDSVKNPKPDFDTGYPDNSDIESLEPETRLKKVKIFTRTLILISLMLLGASMFAISSSASVEGQGGITDTKWNRAFGCEKLSNVTFTSYYNDKVHEIMIVDDGYVSIETFDEYGNQTTYTKREITNSEIEQIIGMSMIDKYSYYVYNADTQSYENGGGCYVKFSKGKVASITLNFGVAEYRYEYTNYGTSKIP